MKKLILFSLFIFTSAAMTSCTADSIADNAPAPTVVTADGGAQTGPTVPPRP